jgi:hypothetical protein
LPDEFLYVEVEKQDQVGAGLPGYEPTTKKALTRPQTAVEGSKTVETRAMMRMESNMKRCQFIPDENTTVAIYEGGKAPKHWEHKTALQNAFAEAKVRRLFDES